jgi:hypothetical protein
MIAESDPATAVDAVPKEGRCSGVAGDTPGAGGWESVKEE